jgi:xylan 1,4-beta-xylosidase
VSKSEGRKERYAGRLTEECDALRRKAVTILTACAWALTGVAGAQTAPPTTQTRPAQVEGYAGRPARTYRNPIIPHIGPADPAVIRYNGTYYLYPTWDCKGYEVFVSKDLVNWERKGKCFADARGGAWAPDVFHDTKGNGGFYLYYTVDRPGGGKLIGVAVSPDPLGPFADQGTLVQDAIDAHVFRDDDGKLYLYYCDLSGGPNRIAVRPMADPLTLTGEPIVLISPTDEWERRGGPIAEGPWMLKHKGVYYLMYSGSGADTPHYAIGYATAKSPLGPFTKHPGNPIAQRGNGIFGPGHHCVVSGPDGKLWMVYHQKRNDQVNWQRFLAIDPLWFDEAGVIHVRISRGTTQPAP